MPKRVSGAGFIALALLTVACSSSSQGGTTAPSPRQLDVKVRDFQIKAPRSIAAGDVVLAGAQRRPGDARADPRALDGKPLPLRADDLTVDEDAVKSRTVSVLDDDHPGSVRHWKIHLAPGRYELFCNMSGHYLGGMHTELVVR